MIGRGVLLEAYDDPSVTELLSVSRRPLGESHPKLRELVLPDFAAPGAFDGRLGGYDACLHCAGVSAMGLDEAEYTRQTYDVALALGRAYLAQNPQGAFLYVSGAGTDSSANGRVMWARVKGRTENDLLALSVGSATMFRPGFIQPLRGITTKVRLYAALYAMLRPLSGALVALNWGTNTTLLGRAMLAAAATPPTQRIVDGKAINAMGRAYRAGA